MERVILHSDLNNFYAAVECLCHPELRAYPVAVCGDVSLRHGIVLAKNGLAKAAGIQTGEAAWQAARKCPNLKVVAPRFPLYLRFAQRARAIYKRYTDQIEPFGLDEAWLDVTGSRLMGDGQQIADQIRNAMREEVGLTVSVGVSNNKVFAKLGSDMRKPDATTVISPENYANTVWKLPVGDLLYVGRATQRKLYNLGIYTIGDLANTQVDLLRSLLGKWGVTLHAYANGQDTSPVAYLGEQDPIKSIGNSTTTPRDLTQPREVQLILQVLAESVAARLREQGLRCRTVQISIRDNQLSWIERQAPLPAPCCLASELAQHAMALFTRVYDWRYPIRSLGLRGANLAAGGNIQLDLLGVEAARLRKQELESAVDEIRKRFGYFSIQRASVLGQGALSTLNPKDDHIAYPGGYSLSSREVQRSGL